MTLVRTNNLTSGKVKSCGCILEGSDLTGQKFGMLTALEKVKIDGKIQWYCRCDCGKDTFVPRNNLLTGNTKSCGCQRYSGLCKLKDHTGEIHGKLTVLERDYKEPKEQGSTSAFWKCKCECGRIVSISSANLKTQLSCGSKGCRTKRYSAKDLTGQKFGRLEVIQRDIEYQKEHNFETPCWKCKCDCGNIVSVKGHYLRTGRIKSCGCYRKDRMRSIAISRNMDVDNPIYSII